MRREKKVGMKAEWERTESETCPSEHQRGLLSPQILVELQSQA